MVNTMYLFSFVETPRKFIIAKLLIRELGSELTDRKLGFNKFTWCFHKAKQVYLVLTCVKQRQELEDFEGCTHGRGK